MGGSVFKAEGAIHHTTKQLERLKIQVENLILKINPRVTVDFPSHLETKKLHGDLDVIVGYVSPLTQTIITRALTKQDFVIKTNGRICSFLLHNLQVDLIFIKKDQVFTALNYFSWGDLGNILSIYAKSFGCKLTDQGLFLEEEIINHGVAKYPIETDYFKILELLGFDLKKHPSKFNSFSDVLLFLQTNKYDLELPEINASLRRRIKNRPNQKEFVDLANIGFFRKKNKFPDLKFGLDVHQENVFLKEAKSYFSRYFGNIITLNNSCFYFSTDKENKAIITCGNKKLLYITFNKQSFFASSLAELNNIITNHMEINYG